MAFATPQFGNPIDARLPDPLPATSRNWLTRSPDIERATRSNVIDERFSTEMFTKFSGLMHRFGSIDGLGIDAVSSSIVVALDDAAPDAGTVNT